MTKTKVLGCKVTEAEYSEVQELARGQGQTISEWLYELVLFATGKLEIKPEILDANQEQIKKIALNVEQQKRRLDYFNRLVIDTTNKMAEVE